MIENISPELLTTYRFVAFSGVKNREKVAFLLDENGEFNIQDEELETLTVFKEEFLNWYFEKLRHAKIEHVIYDSCIHCFPGNMVVILNHGKFPRSILDPSERAKTGLMLEIKDTLITKVGFCYCFLKTENKYVIDIIMENVEKLEAKGLSYKAARRIVKQWENEGKLY